MAILNNKFPSSEQFRKEMLNSFDKQFNEQFVYSSLFPATFNGDNDSVPAEPDLFQVFYQLKCYLNRLINNIHNVLDSSVSLSTKCKELAKHSHNNTVSMCTTEMIETLLSINNHLNEAELQRNLLLLLELTNVLDKIKEDFINRGSVNQDRNSDFYTDNKIQNSLDLFRRKIKELKRQEGDV